MSTALAAIADGAVTIRRASKSFGGKAVLNEVDLDVPAGSVTAIIGPSGSGKSTLLRTINHLERLDEGYVTVGGRLVGVKAHGDRFAELPERAILDQRARIGFVFQSFNLFPHLTALENVVEAPLAHRRPPAEARAAAQRLLERVGLGDRGGAYPSELSGGQKQRVAIARALALDPALILFDEPTSALDPELVSDVLEVIRGLAGSGTTLVIVTHEIAFAREIADQVVFIDDGRVVEQGTPAQVLDRPSHPRTQDFLRRVL
ncbi:amino acid ABC transporter ATP-binding protein [Frondihabitans sp. VKM Ac-2883]|uniref:amino acid ABC transporter ATP-binding protein n=1 Tax=Frondihabitans sp. VKM Ac-2883 TaxID=2783823 RepID=UPI00188B03EB|nr:amino acid ABC transporter ATP-binding protein [Frondihabitans sp. VKM Ac-2883]MBF4576963.1 amino acid ABC transporter ATP-binding protein [Frondihabitans sp. VKM Ac-2883]